MHAIGIDIGGTKIAGGVVSADGRILTQQRIDTPDGADVVDAVAQMIAELSIDHEPVAVGIAIPGFVDLTRETVRIAPNIGGWVNIPVAQLFAERVDLPILIDNDANAAGWAEHRFGAGQDVAHMTMLTIGTGLGGAIIASGEVFRGGFGSAAELGHMCVHPGGLECTCGARGCIEQYASGRALQRYAHERAARDGGGLAQLIADAGEITAPGFVELVESGDEGALGALVDLGTELGKACAILQSVLDPELFVIGGGVSAVGAPLLDPIRAAFESSVSARSSRPIARIELAEMSGDAGLIGAADLARASLGHRR
jgi:glucokinase